MSAELEIIIPVIEPNWHLHRTLGSLLEQSDRHFSVILADNRAATDVEHLNAAEYNSGLANMPVRRLRPSEPLRPIEFWNWAHAQSQAAWLKPLFPGEELKPDYVKRLRETILAKPNARLIRCDTELRTDWGIDSLQAPFFNSTLDARGVLNQLSARFDWLSRSSSFAYERTAWCALNGFSPQLPACAALNLNMLFSLHYGVENIHEKLVSTDLSSESNRVAQNSSRFCYTTELWLILRQAKNYCLSAKMPWPYRCLIWRAFSEVLARR